MAEGAHDIAAWTVATLYLNVFAKVLNIDVHCILRVDKREENNDVHVSNNLRHRHTTAASGPQGHPAASQSPSQYKPTPES